MRRLLLARGFFGVAGLRRTLLQHSFDLRQRNAARLQHYQQMIEKIGGLGDETALALLHGSYRGFDGFLAELLGAMGNALVEQRAGIGLLRARLGAFVHPLFQIGQRELAHGRLSIMDRAASAVRLWPYRLWPH